MSDWNLTLHTNTIFGKGRWQLESCIAHQNQDRHGEEMEEVLVLVVLASTSIYSTIASTGQGGGMHLISQITSYKSYLDLLWS